MRRYAVLPRCGLSDGQTMGARGHGHYHGIVQARVQNDTHAKQGRIAALMLNVHWTCDLYNSEELVRCAAFVRLSRTCKGSRRLFVAFYGAGTGAECSGPCVSKHTRNSLDYEVMQHALRNAPSSIESVLYRCISVTARAFEREINLRFLGTQAGLGAHDGVFELLERADVSVLSGEVDVCGR